MTDRAELRRRLFDEDPEDRRHAANRLRLLAKFGTLTADQRADLDAIDARQRFSASGTIGVASSAARRAVS